MIPPVAVNVLSPTTQYPGANPTVNLVTQPGMANGGPVNSIAGAGTIQPERRLQSYAENIIYKQKQKSRRDHVGDMEVTGMSQYKAVTQFTVQDGALAEKVRIELQANNCPKAIAKSITHQMQLVEREMKVKSKCEVQDGVGNLFKIAWCMVRENDRAHVSFMVFGASFTAKTVDHYEEVKKPKFKEVRVIRTHGWPWQKTREELTEFRKVGEEMVKTPVFKTMTSSQVSACMDMLEFQACEKVLETAEPGFGESPTHRGNQLTTVALRIIGTAAAVAAVFALGKWMCKKETPSTLSFQRFLSS